ncbi:MAG: PIN domain-containing protein [bacterium]
MKILEWDLQVKYLDTNIIIRYLVEKRDSQSEGLKDFFLDMQNGTLEAECLDIVLFQVIFVLKSFYKINKTEIIEGVKRILSLKGFHMKNKRIIERCLELWEIHSGDIIDCYLVANMEFSGEKELFSYDKGIKQLGISIIEP